MNFTASKLNERYETKYKIFKDCGTSINDFIEEKKEKIEIGSYFLKVKYKLMLCRSKKSTQCLSYMSTLSRFLSTLREE